MKYKIKLFGNNIDCNLSVEDGSLVIRLPDEEQEKFNSYLSRVLLRYGASSGEVSTSLEEMLYKAIEVEKSIGGHMSEPTVKLPYEFQPEIKEKLIEAAVLQDISATQLLIRIIETKYKEVMEQ